MSGRITDVQRREILSLLAQGFDRETIAARVGVKPTQVSAINAHLTMGTYGTTPDPEWCVEPTDEDRSRVAAVLGPTSGHARPSAEANAVSIGVDAESGQHVYWNPHPDGGAANPHVLVLGESGFGKTYTICCLLTELALQGVSSIVFDYAQGFSLDHAPSEFIEFARPVAIDAARNGIGINPLQEFPFDLHGPASVAQRVADTFRRVYPGIGIQQHALLREAVLDVLQRPAPSTSRSPDRLPEFGALHRALEEYAADVAHPSRRLAATVAAHISTVFVFNTFRSNGREFRWDNMLNAGQKVFVINLRGLEHSLEKAVTEFLLWNFIGFIESLGPGPLRCFVVLDEAHKLSFDVGSPAEKLLREGRKFGLGVILASQQPEDFSSVAFANTATKIVFQVGDENSSVSRQLHRKIRNAHSFSQIYELITKLPRGSAYVVTDNVGQVTRIDSFQERAGRWNT